MRQCPQQIGLASHVCIPDRERNKEALVLARRGEMRDPPVEAAAILGKQASKERSRCLVLLTVQQPTVLGHTLDCRDEPLVMSGVWWKSERKASSSGAVEP